MWWFFLYWVGPVVGSSKRHNEDLIYSILGQFVWDLWWTSIFPSQFHSAGAPLLEKTKKLFIFLFIFIARLHNMPEGCRESVTSAAGPCSKKKMIFVSGGEFVEEPNNCRFLRKGLQLPIQISIKECHANFSNTDVQVQFCLCVLRHC
jgi:hypothetical protein